MGLQSSSQRLHEQLGLVIANTAAGGRLPSEPYLAQQLGVSRATLREAMRIFETQGLIRRQQGVGTFVLRPGHVIESGLEVLESIENMARRIGLPVFLGDLKIHKRAATEAEAVALAIEPGTEVIHIARTIMAEKRPVAYLIDILKEEVLGSEELMTSFNGSVLDLLLRRGNPPLYNSRCEILATAASAEIARALNIQRGDALLLFESKLYAADGAVIDFSYSYFLPGYFRFHVVREVETAPQTMMR